MGKLLGSKMVPLSCATYRSAPLRPASVRFALLKSASRRYAPLRFAPSRSAPLRSAPLRFAKIRSAPFSSALRRFACAPDFPRESSQSLCCLRISSSSARDLTLPLPSFQVHSFCCCADVGIAAERQSEIAINSELAVARTLIFLRCEGVNESAIIAHADQRRATRREI